MNDDEALIRSIGDNVPVGIWVARAPGGEFVYANAVFAEIMGMRARDDVAVGEYSKPYGIHTPSGELYPEDRLPFVRALRARETVTVDDIVIHRHDGRRVNIRATARPIFEGVGAIKYVVIAFQDITREVTAERARAESEARLQQAEKMESIGKLAGGIAHDFNNLLATIRLIASTLRRVEPDARKAEDLRCIDDVTESALQLTRSLLGFARRGKNLARPLSLNSVVQGMAELIQRAIDRRIDTRFDLRAASGDVVGDHSQLEQVVMNLVLNARDAMLDGGALELSTYDAELDGDAAARFSLRPGAHVVLEVRDSGVGIDPKIKDKIFEPYFTTKTTGAVVGAGLGLATVYGIVKTHAGAIEVLANAPRGTTMRIYFPAATTATRAATPAGGPAELRPGGGTILLVEDERSVRAATARALEQIGYRVIAASDGLEAVLHFQARHGEIVAVVLDMVMPRLSGRATYVALKEIDPAVAVVLTTGFALNEEAEEILALGVRAFIAKPYSIERLSEAIASVLEKR